MNYIGNNSEYFRLRGQIDDVLRMQSATSQVNDVWILRNMLPTKLVLWKEEEFSDQAKPFLELNPRETKRLSPSSLKDRETIYTYYRYKDHREENNLIPFLQPYVVRNFKKNISFGTVEYSSADGHGIVQASNWDLRGIWIHNKLPIPLDVYYKGQLRAQVGGYNGIGYLGGGASSIYFSNGREGLNFMDEIEFKYSLPGKAGKHLFKTVLIDEQCVSVYVGTITGDFTGPNPDNSVYRVDQPSYRSVTNFLPIGRGNSIMTNPTSPFQIIPQSPDTGDYQPIHPIRDIPW